MGEPYLTMAQIEAKYPNEWVFIDRPKVNRYQEVAGGVVVWHHADRDEFDRKLSEFPQVTDGALLYTGKPDPDEILLLNYEL